MKLSFSYSLQQTMNRRRTSSLSRKITVSLALLETLVASGTAASDLNPNILFILTDDLGIGDLGVFYQNARRAAGDPAEPWHATPNLDALAEQGIQLRRHYCPAPVCAPRPIS